MFSRALSKQGQKLLFTPKRFYTPSIKFVYGDRAAIEKEMASRPTRQPWMVDHSQSTTTNTNATRSVVENTQRYEGKPLKHGPLTTKVTHMESTWFGNPFQSKPATPVQFDEKAINLINAGGAI